MPLIVMCGYPCSGKTTRAAELTDYFQRLHHTQLVQDEVVQADFDRNAFYSDYQQEKSFRSALKSEIQKHLSKDTVVILDAANYVKGYRYELYCLSKGLKTTHCVIHCDLPQSDCSDLNGKRPEEFRYTENIFNALIERFEAPDSRNRWDSPLFIVHKDEKLPFANVNEALFLRKAPPPNLSTQTQPLLPTSFLHELDRVTHETIKAIISAQRNTVVGDCITIPGIKDQIPLSTFLTPVQLTRMQRQFITYSRTLPAYESDKIPSMFVQFIIQSL